MAILPGSSALRDAAREYAHVAASMWRKRVNFRRRERIEAGFGVVREPVPTNVRKFTI